MTLVNTNPVRSRTVIVQAGGYAEHEFRSIRVGNAPPIQIDRRTFTVKLSPGAGNRLVIGMKRFTHPPTMRFPWNR